MKTGNKPISLTVTSLGKGRNSAFTLVELIIVITILAILATIGFMSYQSYTADARDANRTTSIKSAQDWLEIYIVKKSSYPTPDSPVTLTWWNTTIVQWVLWETVSNSIKLMWWIKDPKTSSYYVYSTSWNWKYYQIWADLENTVSYNSFANTVYAEWTKALVKWNYTFDPSMPSLITVSWSVNTSSWIFDPNVCFVIDWWTNLVTSNSWTCTQKYKMSLKDFDSSLVWYWDMETLCDWWICWTWNDWYSKNLASNDINILSWTTLRNHNNINFISKTQTWNSINWVKSAYITDFDSALQTSWNIKDIDRSMTISMLFKPNFSTNFPWNNNDIFARNFLYDYYNDNIRLALVEDMNGFYWYKSKPNNQLSKAYNFNFQKDKIYNISVSQNNSMTWWINSSSMKLFINWILQQDNKIETNLSNFSLTWTLLHFWSSAHFPEHCWPTGIFTSIPAWCTFNWTIDDIKLYNRALSDSEIAQQAKIAGF